MSCRLMICSDGEIENASERELIRLAAGYFGEVAQELFESYKEGVAQTVCDAEVSSEIERIQLWLKRAKELAA